MQRPLADEIRPKTLDEVVGQRHLLAPGAVLRRLIESGTEANMVFYGPSGTGKTTIANIVAERTHKALYRLNATTASLQDVKDIIADVGTLLAPGGVLLYLDEIQYFNKKQQQSLLEFMENGKLTLIASTTENPYFYVYGALLSRSTVFEFKAVPPEEAEPAVLRALEIEKERSPLPLEWEEGLPPPAAGTCGRPSTPWSFSATRPSRKRERSFSRKRTPPRWPSAAPCAMTREATPCMTSPPR